MKDKYESDKLMGGMHLLPAYWNDNNTRKRKNRKKTAKMIEAEHQHAKFLKSVGYVAQDKPPPPKPERPYKQVSPCIGVCEIKHGICIGCGRTLRQIEDAGKNIKSYGWDACLKKTPNVASGNYVLGQAYNKGGLVVLSTKEALDPSTGKRR